MNSGEREIIFLERRLQEKSTEQKITQFRLVYGAK